MRLCGNIRRLIFSTLAFLGFVAARDRSDPRLAIPESLEARGYGFGGGKPR